MALLSIQNLSLGYESHVIAKDINFTVNAGDYLYIVGENGSGKSTLMRTLLGLKEPLGGSVLVGDGLKKNEIGYLPQQTVVQKDFPASVREIVLSGCQGRCGLRPFYNREDRNRCEENMERMGITNLANRCYRELSGGQQQRVLLARALCATSKLLLLDEPVSGLDPKVTEEMYRLIADLNQGSIMGGEAITIIMISHDIAAAVKYATHILHIGSEIFFGTKEEYLKSKAGQMFLAGMQDEESAASDAEAAGDSSSAAGKGGEKA
ncbi:MAG: ABC transporter ATP-binding protein [Lachnospiraceae bacterium]|nr:ABC transporter ATP-binding protein [Lachnospiraceae bacterium]